MSLLDTTKGPNQRISNLRQIINTSANWSVDNSPDGTQLFVSHVTSSNNGLQGPSSITVQPAMGGSERTIYRNTTTAITQIRAISNTMLLFVVCNDNSNTSQNGLWRINTDGTGLTQLATDCFNISQYPPQFNTSGVSGDYPWSIVSRDGSMYALTLSTSAVTSNSTNYTSTLLFGSLSGGTPTSFLSTSDNATTVVGWTTM